MSREEHKEQHSKRIHQKETHIKRQVEIRKAHGFQTGRYDDLAEAHRYHKVSGVTCGDSNCAMCGNPRKFFKELTLQEKKSLDVLREGLNESFG